MKALTRNALLAAPLALLLAAVLPGHGAFGWQFLDAFTIAFSFTYVGHLVEALLLKIPGIETPGGKIVRVLGWFAGGLWCYVLARWALVLYGRDTRELPSLLWAECFRRPRVRGSRPAASVRQAQLLQRRVAGEGNYGRALAASDFVQVLFCRRTSGNFLSGSISTLTSSFGISART